MPPDEQSNQTGMQRWWTVFQEYRNVLLAAGGSSLLPVILEYLDLSPPTESIAPLTSLLMVVSVLLVFHFLDGSAKKNVNRAMWASVATTTVAVLIFMFLSQRFVYEVNDLRFYIGCGWTLQAETVAEQVGITADQQCPGQFEELLGRFDGQPGSVFVRDNLTTVEYSVVVSWLVFFLSISTIVACFVTYQTRRRLRS